MNITAIMLGLVVGLLVINANAEEPYSGSTLRFRWQKVITPHSSPAFDHNHRSNAAMIGSKKFAGQGCVDSGLHCTPGGLPCCDAGDDCYADSGSSYTYHF